MKSQTASFFRDFTGEPNSATSPRVLVLRPFIRLVSFVGRQFRPRRLVLIFFTLTVAVVLTGTPGFHRGLTLPPARLVAPRHRPRILDRRGNLYTHFGSEQIDVDYNDLPKHVVQAFLAREDAKFFSHDGISWPGLARAVVVNVIHRKVKQGGSTITAQLVEHAYQLPQKGAWNRWQSKWTEWTLAIRSEKALAAELGGKEAAKKRILAAYLNRVSFGHQVVGLGSAARFYFNKSVKNLTLGEGAILAALLRAPTANSPYLHPDTAREARDAVVKRMLKEGWITENDAKKAKFLVVPNPSPARPQHNGYLPAAIRREVDELIKAGALPKDLWEHEDLVISSTIDLWAQQILDSEISEVCARIDGGFRRSVKDRLEGSALLLDNETGEIRAMVAGQNFRLQQYDLALQSKRQIASTVKPFIYGEYIEAGGRISDRISNAPLSEAERRAFGGWNPDNASGLPVGTYPLTTGLAHSDNHVTYRAALQVGLSTLRETFVRAGLIQAKKTNIDPTAVLGTFEASVAELVSAYSTFPRGGTRVSPRLVKSVQLDSRTIFASGQKTTPVFSRATCASVHQGLREAMVSGTSARAARMNGLHAPVAAKTGTSQRAADAWWVGYVEDFTLGVRFGRDSNRAISSTASAGSVAAPAAVGILKRLSARYPMRDPFPAAHLAPSASATGR